MVARLARTIKMALDGYDVNGGLLALVDVSSYVDDSVGVQYDWGRTDPLAEEPNGGVLKFTLDNFDGRFTPGDPRGYWTSGVNRGLVVHYTLGTRIRRFKVLDAYVTFPNGAAGASQVAITCLDVLGFLSLREMGSLYDERVLSPYRRYLGGLPFNRNQFAKPKGYWPLDDGGNTTQAADRSGNGAASLVVVGDPDNLSWGSGQAPPSDGAGSLVLNGFAEKGDVAPLISSGAAYLKSVGDLGFPSVWSRTGSQVWPGGNVIMSLQMWFKCPQVGPASLLSRLGLWRLDIEGGDQWSCYLRYLPGSPYSLVYLWLRFTSAAGEVRNYYSNTISGPIDPTKTHMMVVDWNLLPDGSAWSPTLYMDGSNGATVLTGVGGEPAIFPKVASPIRPVGLSVGLGPDDGAGTQAFTGTIGRVVLLPDYGRFMGQTLYGYGTANPAFLPLDGGSARMAKLMDGSELYDLKTPVAAPNGYTVADGVAYPTGGQPFMLGPQDTAGKSMLTVISEAMRAERAVFWADTDTSALVGDVAVLNAEQIRFKFARDLHPYAVTMTLDVDQDLAAPPPLAKDVAGRVSSASVSTMRQSVSYADGAAQSVEGRSSGSVTAALQDPSGLYRLAEDRVAAGRGGQFFATSVVVDRLTLDVAKDVHLLEPGQRIQLTNLPRPVLGQLTADHYFIGMSELLTASGEVFTLFLEPADAPAEMVTSGAVGVDSLYSRASAVSGYVLNAAITAAATVLQVKRPTAADLPFSTNAGDYPMSLDLRGERVVLGAVPTVVSSTVQQFTSVTRGAAGTLAKAHLISEPIQLALGPVAAL